MRGLIALRRGVGSGPARLGGVNALDGKAVVVTGAGRGLGAAYATAAAANGASVLCADLDADAAQCTAAAIVEAGGTAVAEQVDVSEWAAATALIQGCVERFGAIDGLVNNAGVVAVASLKEQTEDGLRRVIEVNLLGTAFCGTLALRRMTDRGAGSIVNVTSGAAFGMPRLAGYSASKGGVTSLTYTWAAEVAGTGVRVNAVSPNARTPLADRLAAAFPDIEVGADTPESNAAAVVHLLSDAAADVNGQVYVTGGPSLRRQSSPRITELGTHEDWTPADVAATIRGSAR
jgi:NAD(P)-dependent dehydrogenase (short-subunit alcohol dehydrogenase family)